MNFWFEMAVNAVEVTLILSFLVQYFGYKTETSAKYWGTALIWILSFCIVAFFSWTHLYENYASSLQILVNILFCVTLLRGNIFQKYSCPRLLWVWWPLRQRLQHCWWPSCPVIRWRFC